MGPLRAAVLAAEGPVVPTEPGRQAPTPLRAAARMGALEVEQEVAEVQEMRNPLTVQQEGPVALRLIPPQVEPPGQVWLQEILGVQDLMVRAAAAEQGVPVVGTPMAEEVTAVLVSIG